MTKLGPSRSIDMPLAMEHHGQDPIKFNKEGWERKCSVSYATQGQLVYSDITLPIYTSYQA